VSENIIRVDQNHIAIPGDGCTAIFEPEDVAKHIPHDILPYDLALMVQAKLGPPSHQTAIKRLLTF
jgi:hypothetical protein